MIGFDLGRAGDAMGGDAWRTLFETWPEAIPRRGILVTSFNEQIPFVGFLISGGLLMVDRDKPDTAGARKVIVGWDVIQAVKITEVLDLNRFQVMGFQPPF